MNLPTFTDIFYSQLEFVRSAVSGHSLPPASDSTHRLFLSPCRLVHGKQISMGKKLLLWLHQNQIVDMQHCDFPSILHTSARLTVCYQTRDAFSDSADQKDRRGSLDTCTPRRWSHTWPESKWLVAVLNALNSGSVTVWHWIFTGWAQNRKLYKEHHTLFLLVWWRPWWVQKVATPLHLFVPSSETSEFPWNVLAFVGFPSRKWPRDRRKSGTSMKRNQIING